MVFNDGKTALALQDNQHFVFVQIGGVLVKKLHFTHQREDEDQKSKSTLLRKSLFGFGLIC